jgi:hypothetical protein
MVGSHEEHTGDGHLQTEREGRKDRRKEEQKDTKTDERGHTSKSTVPMRPTSAAY